MLRSDLEAEAAPGAGAFRALTFCAAASKMLLPAATRMGRIRADQGIWGGRGRCACCVRVRA